MKFCAKTESVMKMTQMASKWPQSVVNIYVICVLVSQSNSMLTKGMHSKIECIERDKYSKMQVLQNFKMPVAQNRVFGNQMIFI